MRRPSSKPTTSISRPMRSAPSTTTARPFSPARRAPSVSGSISSRPPTHLRARSRSVSQRKTCAGGRAISTVTSFTPASLRRLARKSPTTATATRAPSATSTIPTRFSMRSPPSAREGRGRSVARARGAGSPGAGGGGGGALLDAHQVARRVAVEELQVDASDVVLADVGAADLGLGLERPADLLELDVVARDEGGHGGHHPRPSPAHVLGDRALLLQHGAQGPHPAQDEVHEDVETGLAPALLARGLLGRGGRGHAGRAGFGGTPGLESLARLAHGLRQLRRGAEALRAVLGERAAQNGHRVQRDAGGPRSGLEGHRVLEVLEEGGHRGVAAEGHLAGEDLVVDDAQRVDVGPMVDLLA